MRITQAFLPQLPNRFMAPSGALLSYQSISSQWSSSLVVPEYKTALIIPLERKLVEHVQSKNLGVLVTHYRPPHAIRVSARNFGCENGIKSIPLYPLFCQAQ